MSNTGDIDIGVDLEKAPSRPQDLTAETNNQGLELNWSAVDQDIPENDHFGGYIVYRSTDADNIGVPITDSLIQGASYQDQNIENGGVYYYHIKAYGGYSGQLASALSKSLRVAVSDTGTIDIGFDWEQSPSKPQDVAATVNDNSLDLTWSAVDQDTAENDNFGGYAVYKSTNPDSIGTPVNSSLVAETSYQDQDIQAGKIYYYRIRAYGGATGSLASDFSKVFRVVVDETGDISINTEWETAPEAPTDITSTLNNGAVELNWSAVAQDTTDNSNFGGYIVYRSTTPDNRGIPVTTSLIGETSYIDQTVKSGTTYYYKVRAYGGSNGSLAGDLSDNIEVTVE